ncbi:YfdX family protein [Rhodopseudomonas palustris]|uniref:YfdX family protein n=1 Tax=Rhodopseudomonas palustris TaxID=1076 RepID=UPI0020CE38FC|nr:YfdX family protein [Rhodopseudomonas palustris]MCP9629550.1 YfdX family protein [Rhodopseudomonas palustris]
MLRVKTTLIAAALATTALCGAVYAADHQISPDQAAAQDFSKLSKDGFNAFQDIREARLALFNGKPDAARKDVNKAMESLEKSKTDDSVFIKAEADLKQPAQSAASNQSPANQSTASTAPVKWLPINGTITVQEDYSAVPAKAAALKTANSQLKAGKQKDALETLKMNDVNVAVALEVAPLDATLKGVDQASKLLDTGKYYEANGALMQVENGVRYSVVDMQDKAPANTATKTSASETKPAATTSGQATAAAPSTSSPSTSTPPAATPATK